MPKEGALSVWWIPQIPSSQQFWTRVDSPEQAGFLVDVLARYDAYQYKNRIKPDYSNAGGLCIFEDEEWLDWIHPETGENFDEWLASEEERKVEETK